MRDILFKTTSRLVVIYNDYVGELTPRLEYFFAHFSSFSKKTLLCFIWQIMGVKELLEQLLGPEIHIWVRRHDAAHL